MRDKKSSLLAAAQLQALMTGGPSAAAPSAPATPVVVNDVQPPAPTPEPAPTTAPRPARAAAAKPAPARVDPLAERLAARHGSTVLAYGVPVRHEVAEQERMVNLCARVPRSLRDAAKAWANQLDMTLEELVALGVTSLLERLSEIDAADSRA